MASTALSRLFGRSDKSDNESRGGGDAESSRSRSSSSNGSRWEDRAQNSVLRPEDPGRPCPIARLSEELLLHIFELVETTSPQTAASLALVHPRFIGPARYVKHRRVSLDLGNLHEVAARLDLIEKASKGRKGGLLSAIRELRVFTRFGRVDATCLERLAGMIADMTGLRAVHWEECSPMPVAMLEGLRGLASPSEPVKLHVVVRDRNGHGVGPGVRKLLTALVGCGGLVSLTLDTAYLDAADCRKITQPLKQILLTCPRLEHLSLDLHLTRVGRLTFGPFFAYPGLGFSGGEHPLRLLTSLTLHGYPWGQKEAPDRPVFHSQGYPADAGADETDYWATHFCWSELQRLDVTLPGLGLPDKQLQLATALAPNLTALREARFETDRDLRGLDLAPFFNTVPSQLESISVPSLEAIGASGLARHAPSLRKLVVHQSQPAEASVLLSEEALETLLTSTPRLEELGLDLQGHDGDWPRAHLDVLARCCPRLRALELWLGLDQEWRHSSARPAPPHLTASTAGQLFSGLRERLPDLQQLRVHSRESSRLSISSPPGPGAYPHDNAANFACCVPERDDQAAAGEVSVTNLRLSPRLNARMQRILRGEERREDVPGNLLALRVALDGPLPYRDWIQWRAEWPMPNALELMDAAEGWSYAEKDKQRLLGFRPKLFQR